MSQQRARTHSVCTTTDRSSERGAVLIVCYLLVVFIVVFQSALMVTTLQEHSAAARSRDFVRVFQTAEAGLDDAISRLKSPVTGYWAACTNFIATDASYAVQCTSADPFRTVISTGTYSTATTGTSTAMVLAQLRRFIPPNLTDNAIYAAGTADLNGNSYDVIGDVLVGGALPDNTGNVTGTVESNPSASPLPALDFAQLHAIALSQGNIYDQVRLDDIQQNQDVFPATFCYNNVGTAPDCTPNVNYIEGDMVLNGAIGTIGGFFVVVGDVLTNPTDPNDTTLNGTGQIEGVIYTTGQFRINGGGGGLNVSGGVLAGTDVVLNGNTTIQYDAGYMQAIEDLNISPSVQTIFWRQCPPLGCS